MRAKKGERLIGLGTHGPLFETEWQVIAGRGKGKLVAGGFTDKQAALDYIKHGGK